MSTILEVTSPEFSGLTNPYTGEPLGVKMMVPKSGAPLFFAPDTYSTTDRFPSRAEMVAAWNRVDGRSGLKDGRAFVCAYTGLPLRPKSNGEQAWFEGGFDPHRLMSRAEFLYFATMRDGFSIYPKPEGAPPRVTRPPQKAPAETSAAPDISAEALKVGEEIAEKLAPEKKTRVSMAMSKRRK